MVEEHNREVIEGRDPNPPEDNDNRELGVIFDMTVEEGDVELCVMDHGDNISIGEIGPFDIENVLKLNKMLSQWLDKFNVAEELRKKV